jgi:hypothetical protein
MLPAIASASGMAELEVLEYSRSSPGASATFGYFRRDDPDLVSSDTLVTPTNDGSGDVFTTYQNLYRDSERVNAGRNRGTALLGPPEPGHSYAKAAGYADAGVNTLGNYTNMGASARVFAGEEASTAVAYARTEIEFTWVVGPGESGAAIGDPVTGLRWEFDAEGFLDVRTVTWPATGASNATGNSSATMDFTATLLRGPTGMCGAFDCPNGAIGAAASLQTALTAQGVTPLSPGAATGLVSRNRSWSASHNTGSLKAGGVFDRGGDSGVVLRTSDTEGGILAEVVGVDTGAGPLNLAYIDFDATVGETLRLNVELTAAASLNGPGEAGADFWQTFGTRIFDPLGRGYDLSFAVAPVPIPAGWALLLGATPMIGRRRRA